MRLLVLLVLLALALIGCAEPYGAVELSYPPELALAAAAAGIRLR